MQFTQVCFYNIPTLKTLHWGKWKEKNRFGALKSDSLSKCLKILFQDCICLETSKNNKRTVEISIYSSVKTDGTVEYWKNYFLATINVIYAFKRINKNTFRGLKKIEKVQMLPNLRETDRVSLVMDNEQLHKGNLFPQRINEFMRLGTVS